MVKNFAKFVTQAQQADRFLGSTVSWIGRIARELLLYAEIAMSKNGKRLILLPSRSTKKGSSSWLRCSTLKPHLQRLGWSPLLIPPQLNKKQRTRIIKIFCPEAALVQQGIHPLNDERYLAGTPYFFDIDDAYYINPKFQDKFRGLCTRAVGVIASSDAIVKWCELHNNNTLKIWTGIELSPRPDTFYHGRREKILLWSHHFMRGEGSNGREVFCRIIESLRPRIDFIVWVVGVHETGDTSDLTRVCEELEVPIKFWGRLDYDAYRGLARSAAVAIDIVDRMNPYTSAKSFGKVLAFMAEGTPVVVSNAAEYPKFFNNKLNGFLADDLEDWVESILMLLRNSDLREEIAQSAYEDLLGRLSIVENAKKIDVFLREGLEALNGPP
jgi:glycosyltransferase involved in cell wall biosynthesis